MASSLYSTYKRSNLVYCIWPLTFILSVSLSFSISHKQICPVLDPVAMPCKRQPIKSLDYTYTYWHLFILRSADTSYLVTGRPLTPEYKRYAHLNERHHLQYSLCVCMCGCVCVGGWECVWCVWVCVHVCCVQLASSQCNGSPVLMYVATTYHLIGPARREVLYSLSVCI